MATPSRHLPGVVQAPLWIAERGDSVFQRLGHQVSFLAQVLGAIPHTLKHYRHQTGVLLVDVMWGNGSVIVGGGTIGVLVFMGAAVGGLERSVVHNHSPENGYFKIRVGTDAK